MKNLILVRHAKSSWKHNLSDVERPLKSRGIIDAYNVSKEFKTSGINVDVVYSSPAERAKKTCEIFSETISSLGERTEIVDDLYDFGGEKLTNFIKLDFSLLSFKYKFYRLTVVIHFIELHCSKLI